MYKLPKRGGGGRGGGEVIWVMPERNRFFNVTSSLSLAQIHNPKIDFSCLKYVDVRLLDCKMPYKFHFMAVGLFRFAKIMILHAFATNFDGFQLLKQFHYT